MGLPLVAVRGVAVTLPPFQPSDQLAHLKPKGYELHRRLGRGVASNAIAVAEIELRLVEGHGRIEADPPVRKADEPGMCSWASAERPPPPIGSFFDWVS